MTRRSLAHLLVGVVITVGSTTWGPPVNPIEYRSEYWVHIKGSIPVGPTSNRSVAEKFAQDMREEGFVVFVMEKLIPSQ